MFGLDAENIQCDKALCRIRNGDCSALEVVYEQLGRKIYFLALSELHNDRDAEDVLQETLIKAVELSEKYQPGTGARAWILTIAKNLSKNKRRRENAQCDIDGLDEALLPAWDSGFGEFEILETLEAVLKEEERQIVLLHVYGGYKFREIADILGIDKETAKKRSQRAMKKLAEMYVDKSNAEPNRNTENKKGRTRI